MNTALDASPLFLESAHGDRVLIRGHVSLGRSRTNRIPILCEKASRRHALVHQDEEGQCLVIDLGSSNGTYVNGQRITHLARLEIGDKIEVGSQCYFLRREDGEGRRPELIENNPEASGAEFVPCWIIIGDTEKPSGAEGSDGQDETYKTIVSWVQVCQRILARTHASISADFQGKLFAYWRDPNREASITNFVAVALRELRTVQGRQRMEFRLALHFGTVVLGSSGPHRKRSLIGTDVTFAFHMQRLAWVLSSPCLISEDANRRIGSLLPTRALEPCGLHSYQGDRRFYSL